MQTVTEIIKEIRANKAELEFLKTGFRQIDEELDGGFLRKELVVIGGATGIGKSYISSQIMLNIAKQGFRCVYFSLEISSEMVVARMIGAISNIKPTRIRSGWLLVDENKKRIEAEAQLEVLNDCMFFYDTIYQLDQITKEVKTNKYDFIIIDFIQNIVSKGEDEYARLSRTALELQKLAKESNCVILVLSQLSNMVAREGNRSPAIEYRGSGSIAMVCDLGFFFERGQPLEGSTSNEVRLNLRKNRRGISGLQFSLRFKIPGGWIEE